MIITHHEALPDDPSFHHRWNDLAAENPLRSWSWLSCWWRHYGRRPATTASRLDDLQLSLSLLTVRDDENGLDGLGKIVGILPCYVEHSLLRGRILRLIGDGEVCSDHLGLLVAPKRVGDVVDALAEHLVEVDQLDAIQFESIDQADVATHRLFDALQQHGMNVGAEPAPNCWSIELPESWDEFLAKQSKSHRKQLRRAERRALQGDVAWRCIDEGEQFDAAWRVLTDLHQRRRNSLGEPGCFASPRWASFHREAAAELLAAGQLRLSTLTMNAHPVAAEYHFVGGPTTYAYQGGVDPERLHDEPGRISLIFAIKQAIAEGSRQFDLMRGDEPYKPHWRATARQTSHLTAVPPRAIAKLRNGARTGFRSARAGAKRIVEIVR